MNRTFLLRLIFRLSALAAALAVILSGVHAGSRARDLSIYTFEVDSSLQQLQVDTGYGYNSDQQWEMKPLGPTDPRVFRLAQVEQLQFAVNSPAISWISSSANCPLSLAKANNPNFEFTLKKMDSTCLIYFDVLDVPDGANVEISSQGVDHRFSNLHSGRQILKLERKQADVEARWATAFAQVTRWEINTGLVDKLRVSEQRTHGAVPFVAVSDDANQFNSHGAETETSFSPENVLPSNDEPIPLLMWFSLLCGVVTYLGVLSVPRVVTFVRRIRRIDGVWPFVLFGSVVTYFIPFLISWYPGITSSDTLSPLVQSNSASYSIWYGLGHPLLDTLLGQLGDARLFLVLQCSIHIAVVTNILYFFIKSERKYSAALFAVAVSVFSIAGNMSGYLYRDSLNGILCLWFLFTIWKNLSEFETKKELPTSGWLLVGVSIFLVAWRQDNAILAALLALALCLRVRSASRITAATVVLLSSIIIISGPPLISTAFEKEQRNYQVTAVINSLGAITHEGNFRETNDLDAKETISTVVPFSVMQKEWTPFNIVYWHSSGNLSPTPKQVLDLQSEFRDLVLNNPEKWLAARFATFGAIINSTSDTTFPSATQSEAASQKNWGLYSSPMTPIRGLAATWLSWQAKSASSMPQLMLLMIAIILFRFAPRAAFVSAFLLLKVLIFFVFAPASVFSYLYDLHLFGLLVLLLSATEISRKMVPNRVLSTKSSGHYKNMSKALFFSKRK